MYRKSLRLAAFGLGAAAALLASTALPANAASTQGRTESVSTTTHRGGTTTDESAFKFVNVFEFYVDGSTSGPRSSSSKARTR